jgi:hypothetical protein
MQKQKGKKRTDIRHRQGRHHTGNSKKGVTPSRRRTNLNPIRVNRVDSVDISGLQVVLNPFEVIARTGGHSFFNDDDAVRKYLRSTHNLLLQINTDWKDLDWRDDTTQGDVLMEMHTRIIAYIKKYDLTHIFDRFDETEYHQFYREQTKSNIYAPSVRFLTELKDIDENLYRIILATIGKVTDHIGMQTWMGAYEMAFDYLKESLKNGDIEEPEAVKDDLDYWEKGEPMILHKDMQAKTKISVATITKWVKAYKWNTVFKKRVLVWLRQSLAVLKQNKTLEHYYCPDMPGENIFPMEFCLFKWSDGEHTNVCHEFYAYMDERMGNCESWGLTNKIATDKPVGKRDTNAITIDRWMAYSYYLFDDNFCKYLIKTKSNKLINIL